MERERHLGERAVALAETMAESGHYNIDGTTVRAHVSATGGKGGFINELLADRGAGSPVKFIVSVMPEAIATRYDQLADSLLAMLFLASARYWLQICPRSLATGIDDFVNAIISDQSAGKVKF